MRTLVLRVSVVALLLTGALATWAIAEDPNSVDALIRAYLAERGATIEVAPAPQLARRYALDLTGVVPSPDDQTACEGKTPGEMFDYFVAKGALPHTGGERAYVWSNLLKDADDYLFSNSTQFSQVAHVRELRDQLRRLYADGWSYQEFARWTLTSQAFLNRFPSPADRANAAFFIFLGRDSLASEVPLGHMWNGYALRNAGIPTAQAETNPDYHVYDFDAARCASGEVTCSADIWGTTGSTPDEAVELIVTSPLFVEAAVGRYWQRYIGKPIPGNDFPEIRRALAQGFVAHGYDVNWLIREITTSAAYNQQMMFRGAL